MKKLWIAGLCLSTLAFIKPMSARAEDGCAPPCKPPDVEVETTVNRRVAKRIPTCECENKKYLLADLKLEKRVYWEEIEVVKCIEKDVTVCKTVPVCVTDPCTGCTKTEYQQQTCVEKVKCDVIETIPVKREYNVLAISNWKTVERKVPKTEICFEIVPEKVITKVPACESAPACAK
jgi:hypothetical protein